MLSFIQTGTVPNCRSTSDNNSGMFSPESFFVWNTFVSLHSKSILYASCTAFHTTASHSGLGSGELCSFQNNTHSFSSKMVVQGYWNTTKIERVYFTRLFSGPIHFFSEVEAWLWFSMFSMSSRLKGFLYDTNRSRYGVRLFGSVLILTDYTRGKNYHCYQ